jgi:hypothetical protein
MDCLFQVSRPYCSDGEDALGVFYGMVEESAKVTTPSRYAC